MATVSFNDTWSSFMNELNGIGIQRTTAARQPAKAEKIAYRLMDAATNVSVHADHTSEWGFRRYEWSLRRVALLTYALQHP